MEAPSLRWILGLAIWAAGGSAWAQSGPLQAPEGADAGRILYSLDERTLRGRQLGVVSNVYRVTPTRAASLLSINEVTSLVQAARVMEGAEGLEWVDETGQVSQMGWLVVRMEAGRPLSIDGVELEPGPALLRLPRGRYQVTVGANTEQMQIYTRSVQARQETVIEVPRLPSVIATTQPAHDGDEGPQHLFTISVYTDSIYIDGAQEALAAPASGWRMEINVEPESRVATVDLREPSRRTAMRRRLGDEMTCPTESVREAPNVAQELLLAAQYAEARACLLRYISRVATDQDAIDLASDLGALLLAEESLGGAEQAQVEGLRRAIRESLSSGDHRALIEASERLLTVLPGDLATVRTLQTTLDTTLGVGGGPPLQFVYVPGRSARPSEHPARVLVPEAPGRGFLLSSTEITNAQFVIFLNSLPNEHTEDSYTIPQSSFSGLVLTFAGDWKAVPGRENHPVTDATWHGAAAYASWMGGRLPQEGEWRWAAQIGQSVEVQSNLSGTKGTTWDVGSAEPDALGLYDMAGNVWEWLGEEWGERRYAIGGSFTTSLATSTPFYTQTVRFDDTSAQIGFRVLMPVPIDSPRP